MRKRILALLLAFVFLASAALTPVSADEETDRILAQINATFAKAKQLSGRTSFRDWCTEYVKYQLIALGITSKGESDIGGNGTPIGASANVVGISIAAKNGTLISWKEYCKYMIPATLIVCAIGTLILFVRHV